MDGRNHAHSVWSRSDEGNMRKFAHNSYTGEGDDFQFNLFIFVCVCGEGGEGVCVWLKSVCVERNC